MTMEDQPTSTSYQRLLDEGKIRDPIPKIQAAGKSTAVFDDSAAKDLQSATGVRAGVGSL